MKGVIGTAILIFAFMFGTGVFSVYATVFIVFSANSYKLPPFAQFGLAILIPVIIVAFPLIAVSLLKSRKWRRDDIIAMPTMLIILPSLIPKIWDQDNKKFTTLRRRVRNAMSANLPRWFYNEKTRQTSQA